MISCVSILQTYHKIYPIGLSTMFRVLETLCRVLRSVSSELRTPWRARTVDPECFMFCPTIPETNNCGAPGSTSIECQALAGCAKDRWNSPEISMW